MFNVIRRSVTPKRAGSCHLGSVVKASKCSIKVKNEPVYDYCRGSPERLALECALQEVACCCEDIPIVVGEEEIRTTEVRYQVMPHNHKRNIACYYHAGPDVINKAIQCAKKSQKAWDSTPLTERINIWTRAADMMADKCRAKLNATTMLGQSKTSMQAEIDSAAELVDFMRFNAYFASKLLDYAPLSPNPEVNLNHLRYRGLEGVVAAISPFNFTAIGGNLAYTPALMGCGVVWKPSDTAVLSNYTIFKIMREAGVPPGVINFVPAAGPVFGDTITCSKDLAGINFTGSVPTFQKLWKSVGSRICDYKNFPRLVGEVGGKNYHLVHCSADVNTVVNATIRSAFEYTGQKCSACSRLYVPCSLWPQIRDCLCATRNMLCIGDPTQIEVFTSAVIDKAAFDRIKGYIDYAKNSPNHEILGGGNYDDSCGYYIEPTIIVTADPHDKLMCEEIFGPVLTVFIYKDCEVNQVMRTIDKSTPFALTGAIFTQDEEFAKCALETLKYSAGNFYINDKCTGAVVGQQPFGGSRWSGTNDKAGSPHYLLKWTSPQSIKETFELTCNFKYPYMES